MHRVLLHCVSFRENLDRIVISSQAAAALSPPAHKSRLERRDLARQRASGWYSLYYILVSHASSATIRPPLLCWVLFAVWWFILSGKTQFTHPHNLESFTATHKCCRFESTCNTNILSLIIHTFKNKMLG